jgi:hypothetical protein
MIDNWNTLSVLKKEDTRAITAENPTGAKGAGGQASGKLGKGRKGKAYINLKQGKETVLADINDGPGEIRHIWMTVTDRTEKDFFVLRDLVLRMHWDGEKEPSVEVPLGDFFCNGFGIKSPVYSLPISVIPHGGMNSYFPMPFHSKAYITIENQHPKDVDAFFYQIDYCLTPSLPENTLQFHAQWRREAITTLKQDYILVDGIRGQGHLVGTYLGLAPLERNWYGEGEVKIYIDDDEEFPTICGTGIEDYYGGAWGFVEKEGQPEATYNSPFLGHPLLHDPGRCNGNGFDDVFIPMRGFYRWHILDPICFSKELKVTVQQIGLEKNGLYERQDDLSSVAYWYQSEPHHRFPDLFPPEKRRPR